MVAAVADEETLHPGAVGQPRDPHVEKHPVDALDLEHRVIGQHITGTARYGHDGLRFGRAAGNGLPTAFCGSYTRSTRFDQGLHPVRTEAPKRHQPTRPSGWGAAPASTTAVDSVHCG